MDKLVMKIPIVNHRGTQREFSATFAETSASSAVKLLLIANLLCFLNVSTQAQQPSPTPSPQQQTLTVPSVATDYRANPSRPLPALNRIGVDTAEQKPLALREAITLALQNNKDIEVARDNVKIAEYDLLTVRGAYDPKFSAQSYYEKIKTPAASFLSGASGAVENADFTSTSRLEGLSPKGGGNYRVDFSAVRATTNNTFTALNPQYPTALTFSFTQPLMRSFRIDLPRR